MKDGTRKEEASSKRAPYSRPELHRVVLKPEEALAAGCKVGGDPSPNDGNACAISSCFSTGS